MKIYVAKAETGNLLLKVDIFFKNKLSDICTWGIKKEIYLFKKNEEK